MIDSPLKKAEAEQMIKDFSTGFYNKFGVNPVVVYEMGEGMREVLKLSDIEDVANEALKKAWYKGHPYPTIRSRKRARIIVTYRHLYFYYARKEGYHFDLIGHRIGYDHASAIHGNKTIENLLKSKDKLLMEEVQKMQEAIIIREAALKGEPLETTQVDQNFEERLP